jgi:hypothetical protein
VVGLPILRLRSDDLKQVSEPATKADADRALREAKDRLHAFGIPAEPQLFLLWFTS